jgi:hypothetical protein
MALFRNQPGTRRADEAEGRYPPGGAVTQASKPSSHHCPGFDFLPSQPRRKLSLSGGSAAKVSEPRLQKIKLKQQKRGEFFAAHPAGSVFGNSGMSGVAFSLVTFFWRSKRK